MTRQQEVDEAMAILKAACDRTWTDETLVQVAQIVVSAIYWRDQQIAAFRAVRATGQEGE
jgi:hypothetical protein